METKIKWYVLKKGRLYKVCSCKQHFWKVVDYADSKPKATKLLFKHVGIGMGLYSV